MKIKVVKYKPNFVDAEQVSQIVEYNAKDHEISPNGSWLLYLKDTVPFIKDYKERHSHFKHFTIEYNTMTQMILFAVHGIWRKPTEEERNSGGWDTSHPDDYKRPVAFLNYMI